MDDWNLDEKSLSNQQNLQHYFNAYAQIFYKEWQKNVGLTFSVGDTTPQFTSIIE